MKRYHINPKTGEPSLCKAQVRCPFASDEDHFVSMGDARKAFEKEMGISFPKPRTPSPYEGTQSFLKYVSTMASNMEDMDEPEELEGWQAAASFTKGFMRILHEPYDSNIYNVSPEVELQNELGDYIPDYLDRKTKRGMKKAIKASAQDYNVYQMHVTMMERQGYIPAHKATDLRLRIDGMALARGNDEALKYQMTGTNEDTSNRELLEKSMLTLSKQAQKEDKREKAEILEDISTWVAGHFEAKR